MTNHETIAMAVVYRFIGEDVEFLLLRRTPDDGGFWQPVTGAIKYGETPRKAAIREVAEETGIEDALHISDELHRQEWGDSAISGVDVVFGFEVSAYTEALLSDEHDAHEWLSIDGALQRMRYDGNKASLRQVHAYALGRGAQG